jgi:hypothetical protein
MLEAVSAQAVHDLADEAARRAARPIVRRRRVA